jgi:hypothetical protein
LRNSATREMPPPDIQTKRIEIAPLRTFRSSEHRVGMEAVEILLYPPTVAS